MRARRFGRVTRDIEVTWGPGVVKHTTRVPAGLEALWLPDPSGGRWVLNEFPLRVFVAGDYSRHDAEHYGLPLPGDAVEEVRA